MPYRSTIRSSALTILAACLAGSGQALAADFATKAPASVVESWTGFYLGASLGSRWLDAQWTTTGLDNGLGSFVTPDPSTNPAGFNSSTFRWGGYAGYNWQFAPQWVVGLEGDFAAGSRKASQGGIPGTFGTSGIATGLLAANHDSAFVKQGWDGSIRARLGVLVTPSLLLYGTGGLAFQQVEVGANCDGTFRSWCLAPHAQSFTSVRTGWTVGGGAEIMLAQRWMMRAEYRYADFGSMTETFFPAGSADQVRMNARLRTSTALGGIAYKF